MTFDNLHGDTVCNCLSNAFERTEQLFARKTDKPVNREKDFESIWERKKRSYPEMLRKLKECTDICGYKGISINEWNNSTKKEVIQKYVTTFGITPSHKDRILVFKFKDNAGKVVFTPRKDDASHYDFYKCDKFSIDFLEIDVTETINLSDYV